MSKLSQNDWDQCINVLQTVSDDPSIADDQKRFKSLISKIYRGAKQRKRKVNTERRKQIDRALLESTQRCRMEPAAAFQTLSTELQRVLVKPNTCYICKQKYHEVDKFYHLLCPACALLNHEKRRQRVDLSGRVALVTGGRIKIGYELVLKLLRDGAQVIATTRFPAVAIKQIMQETDFANFGDRVQYIGLDFRHIPSVENLIEYVQSHFSALDILVNNAAQTIRRPANFYDPLVSQENTIQKCLSAEDSKLLLQLPTPSAVTKNYLLECADIQDFPMDELDIYGQPLDKRANNTWVENIDTVSTIEFVETQVINSFAPFLLTSRLKQHMQKSLFRDRYIVNVSAMEGQFARDSKTTRHPHTNMAKAALNMMTRTSAADYAKSGIYMNSVDTGWITQENPYQRSQKIREMGFVPPLDIIDGAARIYDPIVQGINSNIVYGEFLKDFRAFPW